MLGQILKHEVHKTKHEADAWNPQDKSEKFEYLTCFEKGTFQFDRMFSSPPEKRQKFIERITRNSKIYCAVFEKENPLNVLKIFVISVETVVDEVERQLDNSSNKISHVSLSVKWCEQNGKIVYPNQTNKPAET
ncbi:hypothetical protein IT568_06875 [bacterium]|nr:hypothetical protein [bacterium]